MRRALRWAPALLWAGLIFYLSSQPAAYSPPDPVMDRLVNGGAHFVEYGTFAILLWLPLSDGGRRSTPRVYLLAGLIACLYAASDELHQSLVPGRDADPVDWLVDCVAAAVLLVAVARVRAWHGRRRGAGRGDGR